MNDWILLLKAGLKQPFKDASNFYVTYNWQIYKQDNWNLKTHLFFPSKQSSNKKRIDQRKQLTLLYCKIICIN